MGPFVVFVFASSAHQCDERKLVALEVQPQAELHAAVGGER
jgi:hypothetical protein